MLHSLISVLFPQTCTTCSKLLFRNEKIICLRCRAELPFTNYHTFAENPVEQVFAGRIRLKAATSLLYFYKGEKVQRLMHELKYSGKKEIGEMMGRLLGTKMNESARFKGIDLVIPVPLHKHKQNLRGYNQSAVIASSLSDVMGLSYQDSLLAKNLHTESQTRKGRYQRWNNVSAAYTLNLPEELNNKSILLVDDVITTGATMEACLHTLSKLNNVTLYAASAAIATS